MRRANGARAFLTGVAVLGLALGMMAFWDGTPVAVANPDGSVAPGFAGTTIDGEPVSLEAYRGKPLVLLFWGSW